ncbi:hypothetical protein XELAEV_18039019mg [Xenopus laevis]|uniref:MAP7 domain-containing protein 3 n=1 Tax=Xenopus laevis TaxID=8355 RepID=A0A974C7X1_XENLA|nr:hypothetical protein XELAEV_18039019mg [Xenopus laevis]
MADGSGKLKELREQMVAVAQAQAEERRNQSGSSHVPVQSDLIPKSTKPVIDGSALRTDERQRLARERREERDRINATKESQLLEKEKRAKLQYEKQIEEKLKKLEEQKLKDEQKRAAVEEKRRQKLSEEKERREANVRRTLERSSHLDQRQKRWSWGGGSVEDGDLKYGKRSTSTTNLKQAESVMHKRLSSSSATLQNPDKGTKQRSSSLSRLSNKTTLNSQPHSPRVSNLEKKGGANQKRSSSLSRLSNNPSTSPYVDNVKKEDKTAHRPPTSPLDSSIISRLLAPTQSSLARSKSAAMLSSDGKESPASATTINTPPSVPKGPLRSRSIDRLKSPQNSSPSTATPDPSQKSEHLKQSPPSLGKRPPSPALINSRRRSPSPANTAKRPPSPTLENKKVQKNPSSTPVVTKQRTSSPVVTNKPVPIQRPSLTPNVLNAAKKSAETETKPKEKTQEILAEPKSLQTSEKENASGTPKTKDESNCKNNSGSTTAEEAAKMLAEKRRLAREQREREEQERIQRQEEEKVKQEEMAQKAEEEKAKQIEEAKILEETMKLEAEEEQRKAEEQRIQKEIEQQERLAELQQQKEEAEAKALEEAEKQRHEREKLMQQNMQERLERKKRIEEIMKRTRKTDQMDGRNEDRSDQDPEEEEEDDEDEDDEIDVEANMHGKLNGVDQCEESDEMRKADFMESSALTSVDPLLSDASAPEQNELFINGDKPSSVQKENEEPLETVPPNEFSHVDSDAALSSQDYPPFNEDDKPRVLANNVNGKSSTWTFEEILDLEIHSNSTSLSSDSVNMDLCKKNYIEDANSPGAPKLAFEDGKMNVLSTAIESAAEM